MSLYDKLKAAVAMNSDSKALLAMYWHLAKAFHRFNGKRASEWTGEDVQRFMVYLHEEDYSRSSRKSALCALAYVFKHVLKADMGKLDLPPMPPERKPLKVIPSREEIGRILSGMTGHPRLVAGLLYGAGLRVAEACELRVQDIDFAALTVRIHGGKGDKDRLTLLPVMLVPALQRHLVWRKSIHDIDVANGAGRVELPGRLAIKYPNANRELRWQFLFPSAVLRGQYRWHITPKAVQEQMREASNAAGIMKRVTPHTLRHAYVTHSLQNGNDIATVQQLVGHEDVNTTMIYAHGDAARGVSPLDGVVRLSAPTVNFLVA